MRFNVYNPILKTCPKYLLLPLLVLFTTVTSTAVHAEVTFDGSLGGPTGSMAGPTYDITTDWGTVSGNNLFHSFGQFNVLTGEMATFSGPANIDNIISRVTDGASTIDGTLSSTIDGANLYLLNPFGVIFGPNASLDIMGSFHVATADFIRFADGEVFHADPARNSVLSVAHPAAFGFLTDNPSPVTLDGSALQVPDGKTLSVIAGDISLSGPTTETTATLFAPGGRIDVVSVASPGEVVPNVPGEQSGVDVSSFADLGEISMVNNAEIDVSGNGAGTVFIRGGHLVMEGTDSNNGSVVAAHNTGDLDALDQIVDVEITGELFITGGAVEASSYGDGRAADIRVKAGHMVVGGTLPGGGPTYAAISSNAWDNGDSGTVEVNADNLTVTDGGYISTYTIGEGNGGVLTVNVSGDLEVINNGLIFTQCENSSVTNPGHTGDLAITAGNILLEGQGGVTGLFCQADGGDSGDFKINTGELRINGAAELSNATFNGGSGGLLDINAEAIYISGSPFYYTGIFSNTWGSGSGGDLNLVSGTVELTNRASIQAGTFDGGWAGSGSGNAGNMTLNTDSLVVRNGAFISASGLFGSGGDSGNISITATDITIEGFENSPNPFSQDATGIFAHNADGSGGDVDIQTDTITLRQRGIIDSSSSGSGQGGNIFIDFTEANITDGSIITAGASGSGLGGSIGLTGGNLLVSGVNDKPYTDITGVTSLAHSGIASQATHEYGGEAGSIKIDVDRFEVLDGAQVSTTTYGPGNGGEIDVTADEILISGWNAELAEFLLDMGKDPSFTGSGIFSNTSGSRLGDLATGQSGDINLHVGNIIVEDRGILFSGSDTPGNGGDINITADGSVTLNDGRVMARSFGTGDAGNITITAGGDLESHDGLVSTEATQSGGGVIDIKVPHTFHLVDSKVSTSVQFGASDAGNITVDPEFVVLNDSDIIANAYGGAGGNILIASNVFLADPYSTVDASSTLGIDGEVDIQAPYRYVSGGIGPLSGDFTDPITLLRESCMARATGGRYSSFVVSGREGVPLMPGRFLPSPLPVNAADELFSPASEETRSMSNNDDAGIIQATDRVGTHGKKISSELTIWSTCRVGER